MRAPRKPLSSFEFDSVLRFVQEVIDGDQHRKELLETQGGIAQEWLDLFQLLVEYPNIATDLRSWIFKLMTRLSRKSGLHPQCLTIRDVEKLGDYPVAGGAFGDVWKGRIGQQLVCLKMIRAFDISDLRQILKDYMQEAIIWRQLNHRNLLPFIGVYYLDTEQRQLCLVSPWMEQGDLVQFLKNTSSDLVDHDVLAYDVACGLSYLHAENIVHGDLKGVNILITPDLRACIADFGLSRIAATQILLSETSRSKGTMRWLSPELLRPGPSCNSSKESDVYAYACVCYEIFTGQIPFYELNEPTIIWAVLMEKRHPLRPENCSKLRGSMWDIMVACWNEVPSSRPTMTDILSRIHETNGDHRLEPASEWNDPTFTQIWNNAEHPPVFHAAESILPRSEHFKNELFVSMLKLAAPFSGLFIRGFRIPIPRKFKSLFGGFSMDVASTYESTWTEALGKKSSHLPFSRGRSLSSGSGASPPGSDSFGGMASSSSDTMDEASSPDASHGSDTSIEEDDLIPPSELHYLLKVINDYILQSEEGVKTVITHDEDRILLLNDEDLEMPDNTTLIERHLDLHPIIVKDGCAFIHHSQPSVLIDDAANVKNESDDIEMTLPSGEVENLTSRSLPTSPYEHDPCHVKGFASIDDLDDHSQQSLLNDKSANTSGEGSEMTRVGPRKVENDRLSSYFKFLPGFNGSSKYPSLDNFWHKTWRFIADGLPSLSSTESSSKYSSPRTFSSVSSSSSSQPRKPIIQSFPVQPQVGLVAMHHARAPSYTSSYPEHFHNDATANFFPQVPEVCKNVEPHPHDLSQSIAGFVPPNLGSFPGIPQDLPRREAREQPEVIHHTFGMERGGHPKQIQILGSGDRFSPSQEYNSFIPSPSSNQCPGTTYISQSFYSNPIISNIPPNAPPIPYPSVSPHASPQFPYRPLSSTSDSFINSMIYPDEDQLERCYPRLPTAPCDKKSHESYMSDSQTSLVNPHFATLTAPADSAVVQRALVAPPPLVVAATLRKTYGQHVCPYCEARFTHRQNLENHIRSHSPRICKRCRREFVTEHHCRRHQKTCKGKF